ncbi:hypothetical protein AB0M95_21240 [Sphaerisporangium sp. NPDC051017]|uniref:hypothetical protein n=1 Tax=Sphaerisporangium sp. NPDC051017 TaxID=3154636 RepID=UPI003413A6B8
MDMSWQTTFALACAALFAAIVPGTLGYTTARLETADRQRAELVRLRAEVQSSRQTESSRQTPQQPSEPCTSAGTTTSGSSLPPHQSSQSPESSESSHLSEP